MRELTTVLELRWNHKQDVQWFLELFGRKGLDTAQTKKKALNSFSWFKENG